MDTLAGEASESRGLQAAQDSPQSAEAMLIV
jgi:hypothetical protein